MPTANGSVIYNYGTLTVTDSGTGGTITGGWLSFKGGGIYNTGTLTLNSGTISGNTAKQDGSGVFNNGIFTMSGGAISGNTASNLGGGVFNVDTFTMTGGTITGNTAKLSGGGVYNTGGTFTMTGGTITGNTAKSNGGGVDNYGTFTMSGGATVTGNVKGGTITDGVLSGGTTENVYLPKNQIMTVNGALTGSVGVTAKAGECVFAKADAEYNGGKLTDDDIACFMSDNDAYQVVKDSNGAAKLVPAHSHEWSYSVNEAGDTITASCGGTGDCDITEGLTLTISAPAADTLTYDGTAKAATLNSDYNTTAFPGEYNISYTKQGDTSFTGIPTDAGAYTASVTVGTVTAVISYTITKADPGTPTVTMSGYTYGGTVSTPSIGTYSGGGMVTYYYSTTNSTTGGTEWSNITATTLGAETYYMYAVIAATDNYDSYTTATTSFTVSMASQNSPAAPTKAGATTSSITLAAVSGCEYSKDGTNWQESPEFTGLSQNTSYTFYQRLKGDSNHEPSPASESASFSTNDHAHAWTCSATGATITATCNGEGSCDIQIATLTISAPAADTLTYDGTAKAATLNSDYNTTAFPDTYTISYSKGTTAVNGTPVEAGTYTASVTVGTATASVEFTIAPKAVTAPTIEFSPAAYTYTGTAQEPTTITVKDGTTAIDPSEYTATVTNNVNAGTNTALITITDKEGGNYTVNGKINFSIGKASQSTPAGLSSTNETIKGKSDGTITGLTTAMEYRASAETTYTEVTGTTITGLAAGTYYVRYAGDDNHEVSEDAVVVINEGSMITVQFDADGGTPAPDPASLNFTYGQTVSKPETDPVKEGTTFRFWSADGETEYDFSTQLTANITLTALYSDNTYTITFDTAGGSKIAAITRKYGTAVANPGNPVRKGYTFVKWDKEIPATMPAKDITITAIWAVNQYTITFNTNGGTAIAPITLDYGARIPVPTDPYRPGYTFAGWTPAIPATMPAENITVNAQWRQNVQQSFYVSYPDMTNRHITGGVDKNNVMWLKWDEIPGAENNTLCVEVNGRYVPLQNMRKGTNVRVAIGRSGKYYVSAGDICYLYEFDEKTGAFTKLGRVESGKIDTIVKMDNVKANFMVKYDYYGMNLTDEYFYKLSLSVNTKLTLKLTANKGSITTRWNKLEGATKYRLYKYVNGKLKLVTETTGNSVKINKTKAGKTYTYAVKAFVNGKWTKVYTGDLVNIKAK